MPRAASTSDPAPPFRAGWLATGLLALSACAPGSTARIEQLHVFGSIAQIEIRGAGEAQVDAAIADTAALLNQLHGEWHAWEPSDLTRINAAFAAGESAEAPPSVLALVARAQPLAEATDGLLDPAIGGLIAAWGFHTSSFPVHSPAPGDRALAEWRSATPAISNVSVDGNRLTSSNPRVQLDFGAIAEGAAAEAVIAVLRRHGIRHALVNLGGDVVALGDGDGKPWQVGIRDPFGGVLGGVTLADGEGLFSTGNYNKFRESPSGARWGHILDPRTGHPARGAAAVVVLHPDPVLADAGATALFVAGPSGFERLARRLGLGCAMMVTEENEMLVTAAMKSRLELVREPVSLGAPLALGPACRAASGPGG
jgi:thiamine biosynthesis lipoprotein